MTDSQGQSLFHRSVLFPALVESLRKLDPRVQVRNPVMFVVEIGAVISTVAWLIQAFGGQPLGGGNEPAWYTFTVAVWLWLTVVFANLAEALAEGRGRAQAAALRAMRTETTAQLRDGGQKTASELVRGDVVVVEAGQPIPGDGTVIEGIASVDESAITGESAPVIREAGGDRSAVTGGTRVLSDRIVVEITQEPGQSFLDRMIALVEGASRRKTPNEIALGILLAALTLIFVLVVMALRPFGVFAGTEVSVTTLIALLIALIPTTIGALLSAIGIAGMDRLVRRNVLALSGRAVEASGDVDVLLLDKTGTITLGNRQAAVLIPMPGVSEKDLAQASQLSSLADETPEGRSIVVLAKQYGIREHDLNDMNAHFVPFTAQTRMSGLDYDGTRLRKGAGDAILTWVNDEGGQAPPELEAQLDRIGREGGTPLAVARDSQVLGVIELKDTIKEGMRVRFDHLRAMGIRTVMITGDNRLTAAKIADESGVDDFLAEATPEAKLALIREQQNDGRLVAMTGDGTNDAPALAQADVGVAMNTGTQAAREAGNMVDLDSNPTKLIEIVEVGKQLLITRGALTTFSIANDVAKYFAILPAIFVATYAARRPQDGAAERPEHHEPGDTGERDPVRDRLQRADHPAARAAGPARGALPTHRRQRAASSQHADLRPRRPDRPLHRDQADRPRHPQPAGRVMATSSTRTLDRPARARHPSLALRAQVALARRRLDRELADNPPRWTAALRLRAAHRRDGIRRDLARAHGGGGERTPRQGGGGGVGTALFITGGGGRGGRCPRRGGRRGRGGGGRSLGQARRALARGEDPVARRALAVRAGQLVSPRGRARLVAAVERAVVAALAPRALTSAVAPNPTAVRLNRSALFDLVDRLRSPEPVAAAGVARILVLLRDGCSPLYLPGQPERLSRELDRANRALSP